MLLNTAYKIRGKIAERFLRYVSPSEAYPQAKVIKHLDSEKINTSDIFQLPLPDRCRSLHQEFFYSREGYTTTFPKVLYYPEQNLILTPERKVIVPKNHGRIRPEYIHWKPFFRKKIVRLSGLYTTLRSFRWSYYQTLVDQLPMLYVMNFMPTEEKVKLAYLPPLSPAEEYFVLKRLPKNVELYPVKQGVMYEFENYLYASYLSRIFSGYLPKVYMDDFLKEFLPKRTRRHDRLLYVSRIEAKKGRHIKNEKKLLEFLKPMGFQKVVLEKMAVEEQVEMFFDAKTVVAPHGAGLTNLLFSDNVDVFELFGQSVIWPHYYFICKSRNLRYHNINGSIKGRHENFDVDVDHLVTELKKVL